MRRGNRAVGAIVTSGATSPGGRLLALLLVVGTGTSAAAQAVPDHAAADLGPPATVPPPADDNPAAAIAPEAANTVAFPRAFFDEFRPQTAQDMIGRVPGFNFSGGDSGVRGLNGASGNVLIDGQRPVTKSLALGDVIRRIPASAVLRIDLIRGGAPGIDMQGQTLVANIIRNPNGFSSVTTEFLTKFYDDRRPAIGPRAEGSWTKGDWAVSGSASYRDEREQGNSGEGPIRRVDLLTGAGMASGRYQADWDAKNLTGNTTVEYRHGPDLVRLNLSGGREVALRRDAVSLTTPVSRDELVAQREVELSGEGSLDYEHVFSSALTGRAMLLKRLEEEVNNSTSSGRGPLQQSRNRGLTGETIARTAATIVPDRALTIDVSAEGSFNFLEVDTQLVRGGTPVTLPSANLRVTERRLNLTAFARWQAATWGSVEVGSGFEASRISQSGDANLAKDLGFWKPRVIATIDPAAAWQVRLRTERLVGQLDFQDFAANVSLEPGVTNAGNPNLVPETSWIVEAAIERRFWGRGALTITGNRYWISDAQDLIPIGGLFDAPGNIGSGWRREVRTALTLPTERLGVAGGQVRLNLTWRRSRVTDPTTGERRRISDERPLSGDVALTKDLPRLRSIVGLELYGGFRERNYRLFEIRTERSGADPLSRVYWDYVPNPRTAIRFQLENISARARSRQRTLYNGPRSSGIVSSTEYRRAVLDPFIMMRLRRQF